MTIKTTLIRIDYDSSRRRVIPYDGDWTPEKWTPPPDQLVEAVVDVSDALEVRVKEQPWRQVELILHIFGLLFDQNGRESPAALADGAAPLPPHGD